MSTRPTRSLPRDDLARVSRLARRALRHAGFGALAFALGLALSATLVRLKQRNYVSEEVLYYQQGFQWDSASERMREVGQRLRETALARTRLHELIEEQGLFPRLVAAGKANEAVDEMRKRVSFRVNEGDTMTIAFTGASPQEAQRVTARMGEIVIADYERLRSERIGGAKDFLDSEWRRSRDALRAKESELARFLGRHPEFLPDVATGDPVVRVVNEGAERPRREQQTSAPLDRRGALAEAEQQARAKLRMARQDFDEQSSRFTERNPAVVAAAVVLKEAEEAYQRAARALEGAAAPRGVEAPARPAVEPAPPPARSGGRRPRSTAALETEYARLSREVADERERFQRVDARQFVAAMTASSVTSGDATRIKIIDPAYLPTKATGAGLRALLGGGAAASLLLGLAIALLCAYLDDRIDDHRDVAALGAAVLLERSRLEGPGVRSKGRPRPAGREDVDRRAVLLRAPDSPGAADFRILRHRVARAGEPRSLLVTSAGPDEGKTTCALNLALALSEGGRAKVLLLDGNFRRPALAEVLRPSGSEGARPWQVIGHVTPWLDAAWTPRDAAPPFLEEPWLRATLAGFGAAGYDSIVIDGPPILGSADCNVLEDGVSGVLLTAWRGRSRASALRAAIEQIGAQKVLGVVVMSA